MSSPVGLWEQAYEGVLDARAYGDQVTYRIGADYLSDCEVVEDWGCGLGWMRALVGDHRYRGIDGSDSRFADVVADLATYRSLADGIFIRHVLEHNEGWAAILTNAVASFRRRLVVVVFTPLGDTTRVIARCPRIGVPDISLSRVELVVHFASLRWTERTLKTSSHYGEETMFFVER